MKILQLLFFIIIFSFLMDSNKAQNNHAKEGYYEIKRIGTFCCEGVTTQKWSGISLKEHETQSCSNLK